MDNSEDDLEIQKVRQVAVRWAAAIHDADLDLLRTLMTDDIKVIHGNGRTLSGKEQVLADLSHSFEGFRINQAISCDETIIAGDWAFDQSRVHTTITPKSGAKEKHYYSRTITILRKSRSDDWLVARAIGVIEQSDDSVAAA